MKSLAYTILLIAVGVVQQSCFLQKDEEPTVAKGIVTNRITGEPIKGMPIEVRECLENYTTNCHSLKIVFTDAKGAYEVGFTAQKENYYKLGLGKNDNYETSYELIDDYGFTLESGSVNGVNIATVPFQVLQVDIEVDKQGKNFLDISFQTADSEGNWLGGDVLVDTSKQNSTINTTRYVKVLPQRKYQLTKRLCNRTGVSSPYTYSDCEVIALPAFYFGYADTIRVKLE